jgi:hypothetical protein
LQPAAPSPGDLPSILAINSRCRDGGSFLFALLRGAANKQKPHHLLQCLSASGQRFANPHTMPRTPVLLSTPIGMQIASLTLQAPLAVNVLFSNMPF